MELSSAAIFVPPTLAIRVAGVNAPRTAPIPAIASGTLRRDLHRSEAIDVGYRLGEGLRGFLGQVVPDAALDRPVRVLTGKLAGVGAGVWVRRAVGVPLEGDGGHGDGRQGGEPPLQVVVLRLALGQREPPAVIVDHDRHMIRVVEGGRT